MQAPPGRDHVVVPSEESGVANEPFFDGRVYTQPVIQEYHEDAES
jgi:hypothetical protein